MALEGQLILCGDECSSKALLEDNDQLVAVALDDGGSICKRIGRSFSGQLRHLFQLESIGGKGDSTIVSLDKGHGLGNDIRSVETVRKILGVIYEY